MCTVTFIPLQNGVLITSNRDEKAIRKRAIPPVLYEHDREQVLLYPKDMEAGGTWIGISNQGRAAVLLNGGFVKHEPATSYRRSRGLVLMDILTAGDPVTYFYETDFRQIEPFTIIVWQKTRLHECRWDGAIRHVNELPADKPYIWSSVTLYTSDVIRKREQWFEQWLSRHPQPGQDDILAFHLFGGEGDVQNNLQMNRNGQLFTVSTTSILLTEQHGSMLYKDLLHHRDYPQQIRFVPEKVRI